MPVLLYLIKVGVVLLLITLFYLVFLQKLTFYRLNRWYLAGYSILAFILPFLNVYDFLNPQVTAESGIVSSIPSFQMVFPVIKQKPRSWMQQLNLESIALSLFLLGMLALLLRLAINLASYHRLKKNAVLLQDGSVKIYALTNFPSHFSFGNSIFLSKDNYSNTELERIIMHEYVHVRQRHSLDILLAEILCLIQWFNPFAWMLRKYIRQNLEFLADSDMMRHGISPREYQLLLLKVTGVNPHLVATPFGLSFLKKRIKMMNKNRTSGIHVVKFLFVLPLLLILLLSFRTHPILNVNGKNDNKRPDRFSEKHIPASFNTIGQEVHVLVPEKKGQQPFKSALRTSKSASGPLQDSLIWKNDGKILIVVCKSGVKEEYNLEVESQRKAYIDKYGPLPKPPRDIEAQSKPSESILKLDDGSILRLDDRTKLRLKDMAVAQKIVAEISKAIDSIK